MLYGFRVAKPGLARMRQHMLDHDTGFITANRSQIKDRKTGEVINVTRSQNKVRNEQLFSLLNGIYGITIMRGCYIENYNTPKATKIGEDMSNDNIKYRLTTTIFPD